MIHLNKLYLQPIILAYYYISLSKKVSQYLLLSLSKRKEQNKSKTHVSLKQLVRDNPKYSAKQAA